MTGDIFEFIYGYRGHNYVCVKNNIFSRYHLRGSVYNICKKDNPYNGVMGNEQTIYMILVLCGLYLMFYT